MNLERYPIVYITDDAYVDYTLTSIKSVLSTARRPVKIYVICSAVSPERRSRLLVSDRVELVDVGEAVGHGRYRHVSPASFIKFDIPELIDESVCLYIDGDTIAVDDVTSIFDYDVGDWCAAVMEDFLRNVRKTGLGGDPFYSGTMLMNLDRMRKLGVSDELRRFSEAHSDASVWNEMEILNAVLAGRVLHIPVRWCVSLEKILHGHIKEYRNISLYNSLYGTNYASISDLVADAAIFHFHGDKKTVYENQTVYALVDVVEDRFVRMNAPKTWIFSNVCRFEDAGEFRRAISGLGIGRDDTLVFLNTCALLAKFTDEIPDAKIVTMHRFRRNSSGWWGLDETMRLRSRSGRDFKILLLDNKGNISDLGGRLLSKVSLGTYPDGQMPTTGYLAFRHFRQCGRPYIRLVNFYGNRDNSTPHFKPHGWDFEGKALAKEEHVYLEPEWFSLPDVPDENAEAAKPPLSAPSRTGYNLFKSRCREDSVGVQHGNKLDVLPRI